MSRSPRMAARCTTVSEKKFSFALMYSRRFVFALSTRRRTHAWFERACGIESKGCFFFFFVSSKRSETSLYSSNSYLEKRRFSVLVPHVNLRTLRDQRLQAVQTAIPRRMKNRRALFQEIARVGVDGGMSQEEVQAGD